MEFWVRELLSSLDGEGGGSHSSPSLGWTISSSLSSSYTSSSKLMLSPSSSYHQDLFMELVPLIGIWGIFIPIPPCKVFWTGWPTVRAIVPCIVLCVWVPRRVLRVHRFRPLSRPSRPWIRKDRANPRGFPITYGISSFWLPRIQLRSLDFAINSKISQKIAQIHVLDRSWNLVRFGRFWSIDPLQNSLIYIPLRSHSLIPSFAPSIWGFSSHISAQIASRVCSFRPGASTGVSGENTP